MFTGARTTVLRNAAPALACSSVINTAGAAASSRHLSTSTSRRRSSVTSLFGWFTAKTLPDSDSIVASSTSSSSSKATSASPSSPSSPSSNPHPLPIAAASPSSSDHPTAIQPAHPSVPIRGKMLARDQELLSKLLDREGGAAGVSIVNGRYEEGLGPETKKNMFRLI